jgi:hypothetical protein
MKKFPCLQELPPTEPVDQGDGSEWDTVGEATGSSSPGPTVEELLAQMERQPPAPQGSTEAATAAVEEVVAAEAQESAAPAAVTAEEAKSSFSIGFAYFRSILKIDHIGCSCSRGG